MVEDRIVDVTVWLHVDVDVFSRLFIVPVKQAPRNLRTKT